MLPNSPNVILAAERAAELSEKPARVVSTRAQQEGLAALLAFDPGLPAAENADAVADAARGLTLGGVAAAAKDDPQGRFVPGDAVGYRGDELVAWGDPTETLRATLERVAAGAELVTCIAGRGRAAVARRHRGGAARRRGARLPRRRPARLVVAALRRVTAAAVGPAVQARASRRPKTSPRSHPLRQRRAAGPRRAARARPALDAPPEPPRRAPVRVRDHGQGARRTGHRDAPTT